MKRRQAVLFAAILAVCVGCDHATKQIAGSALGVSTLSLAGDAVRFELAHNRGAFLSIGSGLPSTVHGVLFGLAVPLALALVCFVALRRGLGSGVSLLALGLIAGGGLGNWLDRVMNGGVVTDFVSLGLGSLRTGIFNVADVCIVAGVVLLLVFHRDPAEPELQDA